VPGSSSAESGAAVGPAAALAAPPALHVLLSATELADEASHAAASRILERAAPAALHLRARVPARALFDRALELARIAGANAGWCVVNGRPDIALAASAQAVQLGRSALPPVAVAALRPPGSGLRIGVSVHAPAEAARASLEGADYLVWGTAYETPSHPGHAGAGPEGLADAVRAVLADGRRIPVLAIGGIDHERIGPLVAAGAAGVVVGRAVWSSADPVEAAIALRRALDEALGSTRE